MKIYNYFLIIFLLAASGCSQEQQDLAVDRQTQRLAEQAQNSSDEMDEQQEARRVETYNFVDISPVKTPANAKIEAAKDAAVNTEPKN